MIPILHYKQKEQAINLSQKKFKPKKFLKPKGTSNKSMLENYFFILVIHRQTVKYTITICILKSLTTKKSEKVTFIKTKK